MLSSSSFARNDDAWMSEARRNFKVGGLGVDCKIGDKLERGLEGNMGSLNL